jgi:electron transfer flavoprotein alpha/beta subunit
MNTSNITDDILKQENNYWKAMKDRDVDSAIALTRFPCVVSGPQGTHRIEEPEYRKMMAATDGKQFKDVTIEKPNIEVLNENTALITYSTRVGGMDMIDVSTWVREGGKWVCAFHSENPLSH